MPRSTQREQLFDYPADKPQLFDTSHYDPPAAEPLSAMGEARAAYGNTPWANSAPRPAGRPGHSGNARAKTPASTWPTASRQERVVQDPWGTSHPVGEGEQLPAFMSAREIQTKFQPLEGDREAVYDWREGEATGRSFTTAGQPNAPIQEHDRAGWLKGRYPEGIPSGITHYRDWGHQESDQQVWDRKLEESTLPRSDYDQVHSGGFHSTGGGSDRTPGYDTIMGRSSAQERHPFPSDSAGSATWEQHQNDVDEYIGRRQEEHRWNREAQMDESLHGMMHEAMQPGGVGFKGTIPLGVHPISDAPGAKPQVFGAHHRIAAMADIAPDRLLPVLHYNQFRDARNDPNYT